MTELLSLFLCVGTICILLLPVVCCFFSYCSTVLQENVVSSSGEWEEKGKHKIESTRQILGDTQRQMTFGVFTKRSGKKIERSRGSERGRKSQETHQARGKEKHVTHRLRCCRCSRMSETMNGYGSRLGWIRNWRAKTFVFHSGHVMSKMTRCKFVLFAPLSRFFASTRVSCLLEHGNMWFMLRKFVIRRSPPTFYLLSLPFHAFFRSRPHRRRPPQEF